MFNADLAVVPLALACLYSLAWSLSLAHRLRRIERTSKLDPLTGLGSGDWLQSERWPAALRSGHPLGVMYLETPDSERIDPWRTPTSPTRLVQPDSRQALPSEGVHR